MKVGFAPSDARALTEAEAEGFLDAYVSLQRGGGSDSDSKRHVSRRKKRKA